MSLDPDIVARIRARAIADREIVDNYNANLLSEQSIEPNETLLQAMCGQNIGAALAADAQAKKSKPQQS